MTFSTGFQPAQGRLVFDPAFMLFEDSKDGRQPQTGSFAGRFGRVDFGQRLADLATEIVAARVRGNRFWCIFHHAVILRLFGQVRSHIYLNICLWTMEAK